MPAERVGGIPFGLGSTKPHNYWEVMRTAWENKRHPLFTWRILRDGVCDGCALGTTGMRDFTMKGIHLCTVRLNLLPLRSEEHTSELQSQSNLVCRLLLE